jgi:excisionase family DNA binding protein
VARSASRPDPAALFLTPQQAAAALQISVVTIYRAVDRGQLAAARVGRALRIPRAALDELAQPERTPPKTGHMM